VHAVVAENVCSAPGGSVGFKGLIENPTVIFEVATFPYVSVHVTVSTAPLVWPAVYTVVVPLAALSAGDPEALVLNAHDAHVSVPLFVVSVSVVDAPGTTVAVAGLIESVTVTFATATLPLASVHWTVSTVPAF
jgi:hypothetical protein